MNSRDPSIYVIARPAIDFEQIRLFLEGRSLDWSRTEAVSPAAELIEVAGRLCYLSFTSDTKRVTYPNERYIRNLIDKGHSSVLEHATWSFIIDRVSRSFTHQLVRHRIGFSFSQLSQQYHEESDAGLVEPYGLNRDPELYDRWKQTVAQAKETYDFMLARLKASEGSLDPESLRELRSMARSVLPNALETAIAVTANARALRHFLRVRGAILGDAEMRKVCVQLHSILLGEAPELFGDYQVLDTSDGIGKVVKA